MKTILKILLSVTLFYSFQDTYSQDFKNEDEFSRYLLLKIIKLAKKNQREILDLFIEGIYTVSNTFSSSYMTDDGQSHIIDSETDSMRLIIYKKGEKFYCFQSIISFTDDSAENKIIGGQCIELALKPRNDVNTWVYAEMLCKGDLFKGEGWGGDELYLDVNFNRTIKGKLIFFTRHIIGKKLYPTETTLLGF
jgi:hypothetical protein